MHNNFPVTIIVYTGQPWKDGAHAEIIDLSNPDTSCNDYADIENVVGNAFGGKLNNADFIYCGGWTDYARMGDCYRIGDKFPFVRLSQPRSSAASVVLPNSTLFFTGQYIFHFL